MKIVRFGITSRSSAAILNIFFYENKLPSMLILVNESLNLFFERIKSNMNYSGNPADYCWLIENYSTKR